MRNILLLTRNTLKLMLRKKSNIFLMLLSILIPLIFLAFSFADNSSQLRMGIINKDSSVISS
ncbi:MAG: ABC transporter permease, partial [Thermoanaerobacterium sp.]|nr:ABC transporter permease [Thermoanaerobacterium sp.]